MGLHSCASVSHAPSAFVHSISSSDQGRDLQKLLTPWRCSLWPVTGLPANGQHVYHRVAVRVLRSVRLQFPALSFHSLLALRPCSSEVSLHHHPT